MTQVVDWIFDNKDWLFSGAGVLLIVGIGGFIFKNRRASSAQAIRSGDNSINLQAGRDVNIEDNKKDSDVERQ